MPDDKQPAKQGPVASHSGYSGRLQVLDLPTTSDAVPFVLIFDQWEGPRLTADAIDNIKRQTGARGVLLFEGTVDLA